MKSTDGGSVWFTIENDHMADGGVLATDPGNDSIFWSGGKWYYMSTCVSTDQGWSWVRHNLSPYEGWTYSIAVDPAYSNVVYAGGIPCIYRTTDFGQTWTPCSTGITGYANALAIHPLNSDYIVAGTGDGVFLSSNAGAVWTYRGCTQVNSLLFGSESSDTIMAGTDAGVRQTTDQGTTWIDMGLDSQYVRYLAEYPDTYYYAGTYGAGVYRWTINVGVKEHDPAKSRQGVLSVFPNPFSDGISFKYTISTPARIQISIYDATGRHVKTISHVNHTSGHHSLLWNGQDFNGVECPPGIYFYRTIINQKVLTGSLIRL